MITENSVVALGLFDGVHIAHQALFREALNIANAHSLRSVALTFDPPPKQILSKETSRFLTSPQQKAHYIKDLGIKEVHFLNTNKELLSLSCEDFVSEILVKQLNAKFVVAGFNYRFGKNASGNIDTLISLEQKYNFKVSVIEKMVYNGLDISSSHIRSFIEKGDLKSAKALLGRDYDIWGTVQKGKQLGKKLGFPTINIYPDNSILLPPFGVYATKVVIDEKEYVGVTNIGINPTTDNKSARIETYMPAYCDDAYGKSVKISLLKFIRYEIKFENIEKLKEQIDKDVNKVKKMFDI